MMTQTVTAGEDTPLLPSISGLWQRTTSCLRGHKFSILRGIVGTTCLISTVASSFFLYREMNNQDPNLKIVSAYCLSLGISVRTILESLPISFIEDLLKGTTRWAFEGYQVGWNTYLNVSSSLQPYILNLITCWAGYQLTGDFATWLRSLLKSYLEENHPSQQKTLNINSEDDALPVQESNLKIDAPVVTRLLQPAFNNLKGIILLNTASIASGVGFLALGYVPDWKSSSVEIFLTSLGYLLVGQGMGSLSMEALRGWWEKCERRLQTTDHIPLKLKTLRWVMQWQSRIGVEVITAMPISQNRAGLFGPVGVLYGTVSQLSQRQIQILTPQEYQAKIQKNLSSIFPVVKRTTIKAAEYASLAFFLIFTGWFAYGFAESPLKEKIEIGFLILVTLATGLIARKIDTNFVPGENNRFFNQLHYFLFDNPLTLSIFYSLLTQISAIDDQALNEDSPLKFIFGLTALGLFGASLASGRIASTSLAREEEFVYTSSSFRMASILTILWRCTNQLSSE